MTGRQPLSVIDVSEPCRESWERMQGDDVARFCNRCQRHVHNLSAMPTDEAERLVCESAGTLCIRFERMADGKVLTLDYQSRPPTVRTWRFWVLIGGCIALIAAIAQAVSFFRKPPVQTMMGSMMYLPPPGVGNSVPPTNDSL